jgi:hypothetical protein
MSITRTNVYPFVPRWENAYNTNGGTALTATNHAIHITGHVWWVDGLSHDIRKVRFQFGTVSKAGGGSLLVAMQDPNLTAGPPARGDGTDDQTVAIANGDAGFASDLRYETGNFNADRTAAHGSFLTVVIRAVDFSGDSVQILAAGSGHIHVNNSDMVHFDGTSTYTAYSTGPRASIVLVAADGTLGRFQGMILASVTEITNFSSAATPDERGNIFQVPLIVQCDGIRTLFRMGSTFMDVVLYAGDGSTILGSYRVDDNAIDVSGNYRMYEGYFPPVTLNPGVNYRVTLLPGTGSSRNTFITTGNAADWAVQGFGATCHQTTRTDAGEWTETPTNRELIEPIISGYNSSNVIILDDEE